MVSAATSRPLVTYLVLTFAWFWGCIALGFIDQLHFWVPLLGALAPAIAAIIATGLSSGEVAVRRLLLSLGRWRCAPAWYLVVFGLPACEGLASLGLATRLGVSRATPLAALRPLNAMLPGLWAVLLFAAIEEVAGVVSYFQGFLYPAAPSWRA